MAYQRLLLKPLLRSGPNDNLVLVRKWKDYGVRYGEMEEIGGNERGIMAAYPLES